jgi:zinc-ribbon domain
VYCPSCGSNNQEEVKYCTRCGTNLGVVSDALRGRTTGALETDERTVTLLKDYYRSRRMMIIGGAASALSLFKLTGPFLLGFPDKLIAITILALGFFFLSLLAFVWGLVKWNNASSELKALGFSRSKSSGSAANQLPPPTTQPSLGAMSYGTDQIQIPGSITEQTTHLLEESSPHRQNQPTKAT